MEYNSKKQKTSKLKLFHNATIVMSLMSWYTTFNGFRNSVFSNGQDLTAGLASMAVQVILLGGVLHIFPISENIWSGIVLTAEKLWSNHQRKKAVAEVAKRLFMTSAIWGIFILSMATSIFFSYIAIVNDVYETDFAVNANIKLDGFMRKTVQQMETDNKQYMDKMRQQLIVKLKEKGEMIIIESAKKRGHDYAETNAELLSLVPAKELINLDKTIEKFQKRGLLKDADGNVKYHYHSIRKSYADKLYRDFIRSEKKKDKNNDLANTQFTNGLKNKINNINRDKYSLYGEYHNEYLFAVKQYNRWIMQLKQGNEAPTLEQMRSLNDFAITIRQGVEKLMSRIGKIDTGQAEENTKRLIAEAKMNMDSLDLHVNNICSKVDKMIQNTYGKEFFSFEELISKFGSSETTLDDLNRARNQFLQMQGALLSSDKTGAVQIEEVTELMHELENYIDAVKYDKRLHSLKTKVNSNYNIVKSVDRDGTVDVESESVENITKSVTESAVSASAVVTDITPDEWTDVKKSLMTELDGLITSHPVSLYWPNQTREEDMVLEAEDKDKVFSAIYENYSKEAANYRKLFLDTSEMEKASDLIRGEGNYFPYKEKAILSLIFAIFLDFGAFMLGMVMYFIKKSEKKKEEVEI